MKKKTLNTFIQKRIQENKTLFTTKELEYIKYNKKCIKKIYLLGFLDAKKCYEKDEKKNFLLTWFF